MSQDQQLSNLKKALEQLFNEMERKGMIFGVKDKQALIDTVAKNILTVRPDVTVAELQDSKFQHMLQLSMMSQHLMNNVPTLKLDYTKQFNPKLGLKHEFQLNDKAKKEAEKELKNELKMMLTLMNALTPDPKDKLSEKNIDALATMLAKTAMDNFMKQEEKSTFMQSNSALNIKLEFSKQIQESSLRGKFGVAKAGEVQRPILQAVDNLIGFSNFSGANETSGTFMDELFRFDSKPDALGIEKINQLRDVASGFVGALLATEQAAPESTYKAPTPFSTQCTPNKTGKT